MVDAFLKLCLRVGVEDTALTQDETAARIAI
jgi:hypothetical protein